MVKRPQLRMTKESSLPTQVHMQGSKSKKPVSVDTVLTPAFNLPGDRVTVLQGEGMEW